jgi:hypothetical protein
MWAPSTRGFLTPVCTNSVANGNFQDGITGWTEYGSTRRDHPIHGRRRGFVKHAIHGIVTGHLHGCGAMKPVATSSSPLITSLLVRPIDRYRLTFKAWSGSWDGSDTDILQTMIAGQTWTAGVDHTHEARAALFSGFFACVRRQAAAAKKQENRPLKKKERAFKPNFNALYHPALA